MRVEDYVRVCAGIHHLFEQIKYVDFSISNALQTQPSLGLPLAGEVSSCSGKTNNCLGSVVVGENEYNQAKLAQVFDHSNSQLHNLPPTTHIHQPCMPNQHYTCCGVQSNYQPHQPPHIEQQYTIPCCCWQHANNMNQSLPTPPIQANAGESFSNTGCCHNCNQCSYAVNEATQQNQPNNVENRTECPVSQNTICSCPNCQNVPQSNIHFNDNNASNEPCHSETVAAGIINTSEKYPVDSQINQHFEMQSLPCTQQIQPASQNLQTPLTTIIESDSVAPIEIIPVTQPCQHRCVANSNEPPAPAGHCHHINPVPQVFPSQESIAKPQVEFGKPEALQQIPSNPCTSYPPQVENYQTTPITYPVPTYQTLGRNPCNGLPTGYGRLRTLRMARLTPTHTQSGEFVQSSSHPIRSMGSAPNMTIIDPIVKNYDEMQRLHAERQQNFLQQFSTEYREGRFVDKSNGLDQLDGTRLRFNRNPAEPFNANATVIFVLYTFGGSIAVFNQF